MDPATPPPLPPPKPSAAGATARSRLAEAAYAAERATGDREKTDRSARRNIIARVGVIAAGTVVTLAGLIMLPLPGPGIVVVLIGLGILAQELPWAERLLSFAKRKARVDKVAQQPVWVRVALIAASGAAVVASGAYYLNR